MLSDLRQKDMVGHSAKLSGTAKTAILTPGIRVGRADYYSAIPPETREVILADVGSIQIHGEVVDNLDATPQVVALGHRAHPQEWGAFRGAYPDDQRGRHAFNSQVRYLLRTANERYV
jgi:hypothetical protein